MTTFSMIHSFSSSSMAIFHYTFKNFLIYCFLHNLYFKKPVIRFAKIYLVISLINIGLQVVKSISPRILQILHEIVGFFLQTIATISGRNIQVYKMLTPIHLWSGSKFFLLFATRIQISIKTKKETTYLSTFIV